MEQPSMSSGWKYGAGGEGIPGRNGTPSAEGLGCTAGPAGLTPGCGGWAPVPVGVRCGEAPSSQLTPVGMPASLLGVRRGGSRQCGREGGFRGGLWEAGSGNQPERLFTRFPL